MGIEEAIPLYPPGRKIRINIVEFDYFGEIAKFKIKIC